MKIREIDTNILELIGMVLMLALFFLLGYMAGLNYMAKEIKKELKEELKQECLKQKCPNIECPACPEIKTFEREYLQLQDKVNDFCKEHKRAGICR